MNPLSTTVDSARLRKATTALSRYAPRAAAAALAVLVALQLGLLAPAIASLFVVQNVPTTSVAGARIASVSDALDAIADAHLFGEAREPASSPPEPREAVAAPATTLDLKLTGTLVRANGAASEAIIGDGRNERTYRVGDVLDGGVARLYDVKADSVVLERDGQLETLQPPEWQALKGARENAPNLASAAPDPAPAVGFASTPAATAAAATNAEDIIRFTAYNEGSVAGLRAHPGRDKQTFQLLGLQAGDVITSVDGKPLDGMNSSALLTALRTKTTVNVSIVRQGIPQIVMIPARAFAERLASN